MSLENNNEQTEQEIYYEIDESEIKDKKGKGIKPAKKMSINENASDILDHQKRKIIDDGYQESTLNISKRDQISLESNNEKVLLKEELNVDKLGSFKEDILVSNISNLNLPNIKKAKGYSKYDYIKVKVSLEEHFYVLSRFLVSRMLTLCRIPHYESTKIAKDLKKKLVEENKLQITQEEMNNYLFELMATYGYGEAFSARYNMLSKFYQNRVPLIILISGTMAIGKSIIATHLAERMNISNVLQTEITELIMEKLEEVQPLEDIRLKEFQSVGELINEYKRKCRIVRRGANTDIQKGLKEGKPLIIEGYTVDPNLYIKKLEEQKDDQCQELLNANHEILKKKKLALKEFLQGNNFVKVTKELIHELNSSDHIADKYKIITPEPENIEEKFKEKEREKIIRKEIEKIDQKSAVIVPILLVVNTIDHAYCIETKLNSIKSFEKTSFEQKIAKKKILLDNYQAIQEYLIDNSDFSTTIPISINNYEETLELIQDIIIKKIEAAYQRGDFQKQSSFFFWTKKVNDSTKVTQIITLLKMTFIQLL